MGSKGRQVEMECVGFTVRWRGEVLGMKAVGVGLTV